jgi:hypothetical protein
LVAGSDVMINGARAPLAGQDVMYLGNMPKDGGYLLLEREEADRLLSGDDATRKFLRHFWGADEVINSRPRYCIWIEETQFHEAQNIPEIRDRLNLVAKFRSDSPTDSTRAFASRPYRFVQLSAVSKSTAIVMPRVSSEKREYLPVSVLDKSPVVGDKCYAIYDAPLWNFSLLASRIHLVWIGTVCSRLEMRFSYGNTLGWNTFPVPSLTGKNKADLTRCGEDILLAREAHFPATIADLYDPEKMPDDLRAAHERNDETLERIYIGRRFRNDTERLEKLFDLYTKMIADKALKKSARKGAA